MQILVTGGAGYIGSITANTLIERGHQVVILDDLRTGHQAAIPRQASFVHANVADREAVARTLSAYDVDAIVHFAASSLVGESMQDPLLYFGNNTGGTLNLLSEALKHGVHRFVLSSTAALYGTPSAVPIPENAPLQPESVYGESKYLIERMLRWLGETKGLGWTALRYFNAAGATPDRGEDHRPESHLIPLVLQVALGQRETIDIYGDDYDTPDGTAIRDYIHVLDLAEAHVAAVEALEPGGGTAYNVGTGRGYSVQEVISACREVTGHPIPARTIDRRPGDPPRLVADASKLARDLGVTPKHSDLKSIVSSAWEWHKSRPDGYAD